MPALPDIPLDFNIMAAMSKVIIWMLYFVISSVLIALIVAFFYRFVLYKYKFYYWELYGSTKDGSFALGKLKTNMAMWDKSKKHWKMLYPLFNKKKQQPFDAEYIYPGNICFAFKFNEDFVPGRVNLDNLKKQLEKDPKFQEFNSYVKDLASVLDIKENSSEYVPMAVGGLLNEEEIRASLDPIEYHLRDWHEAEIKQNELEFQVESFWDQNRNFFMVLGTSLICLVMVCATLWFAYKMTVEGRPDGAALTNALQGLADSLGNRGATPS